MKAINKSLEIYIKDNFVHVKNYNNIINITNNHIQLNNVVISGFELIICKLDEYELTIKGKIKGITFND